MFDERLRNIDKMLNDPRILLNLDEEIESNNVELINNTAFIPDN